MNPPKRVPSRFANPRHADPEGFAQLPAVRQWAALRMHVATVEQYLGLPLAVAGVGSIMAGSDLILYDFGRAGLRPEPNARSVVVHG
ncbi:hypothetical protein JKP88DRAFT_288400 [Tribonema minus]|uniref:Uncharacterized protein n=1 Tax=Tribonema minus TaxID=303371 RepID=A0A835Z5U8_9STRA|nr:hypothetical protein JKP88DRAFT_288400 [Tribonema minus]